MSLSETTANRPSDSTTTPYKLEIIGDYLLDKARVELAKDGKTYEIEAGTHIIVGAMADQVNGRMLQAAVVYKGVEKNSREERLLPEPLSIKNFDKLQLLGVVKVNAENRKEVEETLNLHRKQSQQAHVAQTKTLTK